MDCGSWLVVFCTETIIQHIAKYLTSRELFPFLLGVAWPLRHRALPSERGGWNKILHYQARVFSLCGISYAETKEENILKKFIRRLYRRRVCSLCLRQAFRPSFPLYPRFNAKGLKVCPTCMPRRLLTPTARELAIRYLWEDGQFLFLPEGIPLRRELHLFKPQIYLESQLCLYDKHAIFTVPVVDFYGNERLASFQIRGD